MVIWPPLGKETRCRLLPALQDPERIPVLHHSLERERHLTAQLLSGLASLRNMPSLSLPSSLKTEMVKADVRSLTMGNRTHMQKSLGEEPSFPGGTQVAKAAIPSMLFQIVYSRLTVNSYGVNEILWQFQIPEFSVVTYHLSHSHHHHLTVTVFLGCRP